MGNRVSPLPEFTGMIYYHNFFLNNIYLTMSMVLDKMDFRFNDFVRGGFSIYFGLRLSIRDSILSFSFFS